MTVLSVLRSSRYPLSRPEADGRDPANGLAMPGNNQPFFRQVLDQAEALAPELGDTQIW
jgi:hypothetical protein